MGLLAMLLAMQTTDTPVWWLVGVTAGLVLVTGVLAVAALRVGGLCFVL
jgi:hypothetical protein